MGSIDLTHLIYNRVKNFSSQQVSRDGQLTINQANRWIMWIFGIETCEEEHALCQNVNLVNRTEKGQN